MQERPAAARWARPRENPRGQQVRANAVNRGRRAPAAAHSLRRYGGGVEARRRPDRALRSLRSAGPGVARVPPECPRPSTALVNRQWDGYALITAANAGVPDGQIPASSVACGGSERAGGHQSCDRPRLGAARESAPAADKSAQRRALTSLRRSSAMKRGPAIPTSRRPRSVATRSDLDTVAESGWRGHRARRPSPGRGVGQRRRVPDRRRPSSQSVEVAERPGSGALPDDTVTIPHQARHQAPPPGRRGSAARPAPAPQENQQQTEQAGAGQRQRGYGLHGGVVGRRRREGSQVIAG